MTISTNNDVTLKNSTYNSKNGRYALGGITEISSFALEWWKKNTISPDPTDLIYVMEKKYEGRPDMLGLVFYGDVGLWWIICQYNTILDPMEELIEGKTLIIPMLNRVMTELKSQAQVGGIKSTRGV